MISNAGKWCFWPPIIKPKARSSWTVAHRTSRSIIGELLAVVAASASGAHGCSRVTRHQAAVGALCCGCGVGLGCERPAETLPKIVHRLAMAQCLLAFEVLAILDRRRTWSLIPGVLSRYWRRRALAAHEELIFLLLVGFHLMHPSQTALHTLDVVIDIWWSLNRSVVIVITYTATTPIASLQTSHPGRSLMNLVESIGRPRIRRRFYFR